MTSRGRLGQALVAAWFDAGATVLRRDGNAARVLVDVAGFFADTDPQLATLGAAPDAADRHAGAGMVWHGKVEAEQAVMEPTNPLI